MKSFTLAKQLRGFSLIELIVVLVILAVLAAFILPRFVGLTSAARISVIEGIAGTMRSTAELAKSKALASGLTPRGSNPGGAQDRLVVDFGFGRVEVDWRNLCPEARGEFGDDLDMTDFFELEGDPDLTTRTNNQYTLVGYEIPPGFSNPTNQGCYVIYDSFGNPNCTITAVTVDC